jgi:hypothetical protein
VLLGGLVDLILGLIKASNRRATEASDSDPRAYEVGSNTQPEKDPGFAIGTKSQRSSRGATVRRS